MMIQAVLGNPHHPEYGVATIPFPIPHDQYTHCMELLEALEIGDAVKTDCQVQEITSFYSVLKRTEMLTVNVEELNYLAKRLDSFDTGEDGHIGESAAGVCPTGTKRPSSCSRHTRAFGAGWSGNAGMTALTSKASGSEESSRSYTASTRRRRPLRSAAVISLSQTLRLRNWSQMRRST